MMVSKRQAKTPSPTCEPFEKYEHEIEDVDELGKVPTDLDLRVYEGKELELMRRLIRKGK